MAPQGLTPIKPGDGSMEERGAAHLTSVVCRRVPLNRGPHRVAVVGWDVVALTVDVEEHVHFLGQRVLRGVHVGVSQSRVVGVRMLYPGVVVVTHPPRLLRRNFHHLQTTVSAQLTTSENANK